MSDLTNHDGRIRLLQGFPLFQHTAPEMLEEIVTRSEVVQFAPQEVIIPFGPPVTYLGVVTLLNRKEALMLVGMARARLAR